MTGTPSQPLRVAFRADASRAIGSGHVMRCLALAEALRAQGAQVRFVCRDGPGHLGARIQASGFELRWLPADNDAAGDAACSLAALGDQHWDWLVVDHYGLAADWEAALRPVCRRLMAIDDLADRPHRVDLLLDQNLGRRDSDYAHLLAPGAKRLIGPGHALLRPEFAAMRAASLARRAGGGLRQLLVSMGGADPGDTTPRVLRALVDGAGPDGLGVTVVLGALAETRQAVEALVASQPASWRLLVDVADMAVLLAGCDLAIGAAGSSAWERCCLGVPTLQLVLADNQAEAARHLQACGAARTLAMEPGWEAALRRFVADAAVDPRLLCAMSAQAAAVTDGSGVQRVLQAMQAVQNDHPEESAMPPAQQLRPIQEHELPLMLAWRNAPEVRRNMYTRHEISLDEHLQWWAGIRARDDVDYWMFDADGVPLGIVGFTAIDRRNRHASWAVYAAPDAPRGTGSRMELLALDHAFGEMALHKLHCEVLDFNAPVIKLHEKFGFRVEGTLRQHHRLEDDRYADIVKLGILADEWRSRRPEMIRRLAALSDSRNTP